MGKRADVVILSASPLAVDPGAIKDIRVEETIKDVATAWRWPAADPPATR